ncbi:acyl-CoA thioesterase [Microvirga arsenatis]|uniref:Acyl-CoA thioesterase n=1 Tax=Microvirga arsenatis TaxID=2692265 RepID=A0ABW9YTJ3_9HYPH|nr:thioesterase family protein [Microvirga arsenatis]NBJ09691.1 acyl-CoA thioesterase [Microvirga arsenatis]NBJ23450.1 acyl-CoA thioesterase [Microvirga arsenatis]
MSDRPVRADRSAFRLFRPIATRWMDNDAYGHVNNVHYYSYFDSAVNGWLVEKGLLAIAESPVVGLVVESGCSYFESVAFPDALEAGLAVAHLGRSSVRYRIGIFKKGSALAAAQGHFVHVYVDRATQRPVEIPPATREALAMLQGP